MRIIFFLVLNFLANISIFSAANDNFCVEDINSLINVFGSNETSTDNILRIQKTFYNDKSPHYVTVYYCYEQPCSTESDANFTYIWTDNLIFFVINYHLFRALTFELADLGEAETQFFIVPEFCNKSMDINDIEESYRILTVQLKSIGGNDKDTQYHARKFEENSTDQKKEYNIAKILIAIWLPFTSLICIIVAHIVLLNEKGRKTLGKYIGKYFSKYVPLQSGEKDDEKVLFFFLKRMFIPVATLVVIIATAYDIWLYIKFRHTSIRFLYLFPMPIVSPVLFLVNICITITTSIIFCCKQNCPDKYLLIYTCLVPLFGTTYVCYHGFWILVAIMTYPGRILIGAVFVIPLILFTIPPWNMLIEIKSLWQSAPTKQKCLCGCGLWSLLLVTDVLFWVLLLAILYFISKFLLESSVPTNEALVKSILTYVVVNFFSGILLWLNTGLVQEVSNFIKGVKKMPVTEEMTELLMVS